MIDTDGMQERSHIEEVYEMGTELQNNDEIITVPESTSDGYDEQSVGGCEEQSVVESEQQSVVESTSCRLSQFV